MGRTGNGATSWETGHLRRLTLAALLLVTALALIGCDRFYSLTIENYTTEGIVAYVEGGEFELGPCSILRAGSIPGPPLGRLSIEVVDTQGRPIEDTRDSFEDEAEYYLLLQVGDPQHNACAPVRQEFRLEVVNYSTRVVYVWLGDELLGPVPIGKTENFDIPHEWRRTRDLHLRDESGQVLGVEAAIGGMGSVEFVMGETPEFIWAIHQGLAKPTRRPSQTP